MSVTVSVCFVTALLVGFFQGTGAQCNGDTKKLKAVNSFKSFYSPNYPKAYPGNAHCQWLIEAPSDAYVIRMDTLSLQLEDNTDCSYDSITIYNGKLKSSEARKFCRGLFRVYTTEPYLGVVFQSDGSVQRRGFHFRYLAMLKNPPSTLARTTTLATTLTTQRQAQKGGLNKALLIGGLVGGVCFVIILGIICGKCLGRGGPRQPPVHRPAAFYHSHAPPTPLHAAGDNSTVSAAVHMVQNNNAVFMLSQAMGGSLPPSAFGPHHSHGVTNPAFDNTAESPMGTSAIGSAAYGILGTPIGIPPPTYAETMQMTRSVTIPTTPHHMPSAPLVPLGGGVGLSPPPLYAPRHIATSPSGDGSFEVTGSESPAVQPQPQQDTFSGARAPQSLDHTTPLITPVSIPRELVPSTSTSPGSQRLQEINDELESNPTFSDYVLTSPSLAVADPGAQDIHLLQENEVIQSEGATEPQFTESVRNDHQASSLELPGNRPTARSSLSQSIYHQPDDFSNNTVPNLMDFSPDEGEFSSKKEVTRPDQSLEESCESDPPSIMATHLQDLDQVVDTQMSCAVTDISWIDERDSGSIAQSPCLSRVVQQDATDLTPARNTESLSAAAIESSTGHNDHYSTLKENSMNPKCSHQISSRESPGDPYPESNPDISTVFSGISKPSPCPAGSQPSAASQNPSNHNRPSSSDFLHSCVERTASGSILPPPPALYDVTQDTDIFPPPPPLPLVSQDDCVGGHGPSPETPRSGSADGHL